MFTVALAAAAGVSIIAIAPRLNLPSIALLLVAGVVLGPEVLGWVDPASLGTGLSTIVQLAVAVILFEGGLTLDIDGYRRASKTITRMLTVGVLITWGGTALALHGLLGLPFDTSILGGSLVIVTGPTVVSPLLRRLGVRDRLYHVLYWEGVLIDAVGVFAAILCFEYVVTDPAQRSLLGLLQNFGLRVILGLAIGGGAGWLLDKILRSDLIPNELTNIFVLSAALLIFGLCDRLLHESGILGVITAGLVLGIKRPPHLKRVKRFKLELTELSIGLLFILLTARLQLESLQNLGFGLVMVLAVIMLVLRPLNILVATWGQGFSRGERIFLSWLAPRGIVAASMASLVSLQMEALGVPGAEVIAPFTFAVIGATVIIQGLTSPTLVRALKLQKPPRHTWLLLGRAGATLPLGRAMVDAGARVIVVAADFDEVGGGPDPVGLTRVIGDPLDPDLPGDLRLLAAGNVLALFQNPHANRLVCQQWMPYVGRSHCFRWADLDTAEATSGAQSCGLPIWSHVPNPGELLLGLASGALRFSSLRMTAPTPILSRDGHCVLLRVSGDRATPIHGHGPEQASAGDCVIALERPVQLDIGALIRSVRVITDPAPTFAGTLHALVQQVQSDLPQLDTAALHTDLMAVQAHVSAAVGHGVAIPHAYVPGLGQPSCWVASVPAGLDLCAPDGLPVRLVYLILSPPEAAEAHLEGLATVARVSAAPALQPVLSGDRVMSADDLLKALREAVTS